MSEAPQAAAAATVRRIRAPQDFWGGLVLMAVAAFAWWASSDLAGMRGFSFGPGTAPRMFAALLFLLGAGISVMGLLSDGPPLQRYGVRGPVFVTLAILAFAISIRPMGLIFSAFVAFMVAAIGSDETRWGQTLIVGIVLTAGCCLLFRYALGLPLELLPRFIR